METFTTDVQRLLQYTHFSFVSLVYWIVVALPQDCCVFFGLSQVPQEASLLNPQPFIGPDDSKDKKRDEIFMKYLLFNIEECWC